MKVGLVSSLAPHFHGGYRFIVDWLEPHIRAAGHEVQAIYIPNTSQDPLAELITFRMIDLSHSCDRVITFRPPAHAIPHPKKVIWFIHHERLYYDLWDSEYRHFPITESQRATRTALHEADTVALREAHALFCNSVAVQKRIRTFNQVEAEVLYPPLANPEAFYFSGLGDEILSVCRIVPHKRQLLMIEAMAHTKTPVRLRIAGPVQDRNYLGLMLHAVAKHGLQERVTILAEWISEDQKRLWHSNALASIYIPEDEDSYGYPTLEAAQSGKPTITTSDSGGVIEFVEANVTGLVADAEPRSLAQSIDQLWQDRQLSARLGQGARQKINELEISWSHVVERLLA